MILSGGCSGSIEGGTNKEAQGDSENKFKGMNNINWLKK